MFYGMEEVFKIHSMLKCIYSRCRSGIGNKKRKEFIHFLLKKSVATHG
jgi:hypothetical protein